MKEHNLDLENKKYPEEELENKINSFDEDDWYSISEYQSLSEEFIEKYSNKLNWYWISKRQSLSEKFIEKHSDKVVWEFISELQSLSEEFIRKHINKIHISWLMNNNFISRKLKNKIKKEIKTLKEII